jgi:hypothetical protein
MKKNYFKVIFIIGIFLLSIIASNSVSAQSVVSSQSYDGTTFVPAGWQLFPIITNPNAPVWSRRTTGTPTLAVTPHSGAAMASFRTTAGAPGNFQCLVSPVIDLTNRGASAASLNFWLFRDSINAANLDSLVILMNTTPDTTGAQVIGTIARNRFVNLPDTQSRNGWYNYTFTYPASFTGATNYFLLKGIAYQGVRLYLDDISWDAFPPLCTGIPNVGAIVNGTNTICGGAGATTLSLSSPIIGVAGLTYQWMTASSAAGTFTNFGTGLITENTGTIAATTFYQCMVTCSNSGLTYTTPVDSVVVSPNLPPTVTVNPTNATVCAGTSVAFQAFGASTYTWTPAATITLVSIAGDSVLAHPTTPTNYTVTGMDAFGCTATANVNVNVSNPPNATITSSIPSDTICAGSQVILSAPNGFGATYSWSNGPVTRRDTISPTSTTTYILTVTNNNGCSASDTVTVVVNVGTPPVVVVTPTTAVYCTGGPGVMLIASGANTYTWTPSNTLSSATNDTVYATPAGGGGGGGATIYTVTGSNGVCSASATVAITRSTPPAKTAILILAGNDTICSGTTVILRAGPGGPYTYSWSNGPVTRNDTIVPTASGLYVATVTSAGGCSTKDSINIVLTAGTAPTLSFTPNSPATSCDGNPVTITASGTGTSYTWTPATGLDTNVGPVVVATPANTTNYLVTTVLGNCVNTATFTVNVGNSPALNPSVYDLVGGGNLLSDTLCSGLTVALNALPGGGALPYTYIWSDGKTTRRDTITTTTSSTYVVTATSNVGCVATDSIHLTVVPAAAASFTYTTANKTFTFSDASVGALSWNWSYGDGNTSTSQNSVYTYNAAGTYTVTLIITGGCGNDTTKQDITVNADGIEAIANNAIATYPNPASTQLTVLSAALPIAKIEVMNNLGQVINVVNTNSNKAIVNVASFSNGIYLLRVTDKKGQSSLRKFSKQ